MESNGIVGTMYSIHHHGSMPFKKFFALPSLWSLAFALHATAAGRATTSRNFHAKRIQPHEREVLRKPNRSIHVPVDDMCCKASLVGSERCGHEECLSTVGFAVYMLVQAPWLFLANKLSIGLLWLE